MKLQTPDGVWQVEIIKVTHATEQGPVSAEEIRVRHYGIKEPAILTLECLQAQTWFADLIEVKEEA